MCCLFLCVFFFSYTYHLFLFSSSSFILTNVHDTPKAIITIIQQLSFCIFVYNLNCESFTFSSLRWKAAFLFTNKTNFPLQALSMILNTFFPFILFFFQGNVHSESRGIGNRYHIARHFALLLGVIVSMISVLVNTTSPVIWSHFTPVMIYVVAIYLLNTIITAVLIRS